jgi:hypothetical protein
LAVDKVGIADLRWPVIIARRDQSPSPDGAISEELTNILQVRADVQPIGALTFLEGQQTDRPITHRIRMRWLDWLDQTHVVIRESRRADNTLRREVFRIRRVKELGGVKRFIELEVEQESRA